MDSDSEEESYERLELPIINFPHFNVISERSQTMRLKPQSYYRYINPNSQRSGLSSFYGEDCSFCCGQMFDSCDFAVEFFFTEKTPVTVIPHHQFSYRGPLRSHNITIVAIYYRNPPYDYDNDFFLDQLKRIYKEVPPQTLFYEVESYPTPQTVEIFSIRQKLNK